MLEDFDDDFPTATATSSSDVLQDIPDGSYEFSVKSFAVKETGQTGPLVSMKLELLSEGSHAGGETERTYWLTKKGDSGERVKNNEQIASLRKDLETLGFDVSNWTKENSRPFSLEVKKVGACIAGVCFKAKKKQGGKKNNGSGFYQNLYINERSKEDGKPAVFGAAELNEANADPFGD